MSAPEQAPNPYTYHINAPSQLTDDELRQVQAVDQLAATKAFLGDTIDGRLIGQEEIDHFAGMDDPASYIAKLRQPNRRVGDDYGPNQSFWEPHIVTIREGDVIVGSLRTAMNVSGTRWQRFAKRTFSPSHTYVHQSMISLHPDVQSQGHANAMEAVAMVNRSRSDTTTAYVHRGVSEGLFWHMGVVLEFDSELAGSNQPFGSEFGDVEMTRLHTNVGSLLDKLLEDEPHGEAIKAILPDVKSGLSPLDVLAVNAVRLA